MKNKILTLQSQVAFGYVGNNIAELAIQLHGIDIIAIPTVLLSAHTDNEKVYGEPTSPSLFADLLKGIDALEIKKDINLAITGYFGSKDLIELSAGYISSLKWEQPCTYICDPVMGDFRTDGLYIPEEVAQGIIEKFIPLSDIITPNHFEFEYILQQEVRSESALVELIKSHKLLKDKIIVATSVALEDTPADVLETLIIRNGNIKRIASEKVHIDTVGTGDLFTSLLASQIALGASIENAVSVSANYISAVLKYVRSQNLREFNCEALIKFWGMLRNQ